MEIKKIKISELPITEDLNGLKTLGTTAENISAAAELTFISEAAASAREAAENANQAAENANSSATNADEKAQNAQRAANNAIASANAADQAATNANTATTRATEAADKAENAASAAVGVVNEAKQAADNANQAALNANQAATEAQTQANYAKEQGDYAKAEGDRVLAEKGQPGGLAELDETGRVPVSQLPDSVWTSENFNPDSKLNKSGGTMTGDLTLTDGKIIRNSEGLNIVASDAGGVSVGFGGGQTYLYSRSPIIRNNGSNNFTLFDTENLGNATQSAGGLMSAADKTKLDNMSGGGGMDATFLEFNAAETAEQFKARNAAVLLSFVRSLLAGKSPLLFLKFTASQYPNGNYMDDGIRTANYSYSKGSGDAPQAMIFVSSLQCYSSPPDAPNKIMNDLTSVQISATNLANISINDISIGLYTVSDSYILTSDQS